LLHTVTYTHICSHTQTRTHYPMRPCTSKRPSHSNCGARQSRRTRFVQLITTGSRQPITTTQCSLTPPPAARHTSTVAHDSLDEQISFSLLLRAQANLSPLPSSPVHTHAHTTQCPPTPAAARHTSTVAPNILDLQVDVHVSPRVILRFFLVDSIQEELHCAVQLVEYLNIHAYT